MPGRLPVAAVGSSTPPDSRDPDRDNFPDNFGISVTSS